MKTYWDDDFGDRRQELVFIGLSAEMNEQEISAKLDRCLVDDYLVDPHRHGKADDPFPVWFKQTT